MSVVRSVGLDTSEAEAGFQALQKHAIAAESMIEKVEAEAKEADITLQHLDRHAKITLGSVLSATRKGHASLLLLGQIFGMAIPQYINIAIQSVFFAAEAMTTLAAAESLTVIGAAKAALTFGVAAAMFYQAMQMQQYQSEATAQLNATLQFIQMWSN